MEGGGIALREPCYALLDGVAIAVAAHHTLARTRLLRLLLDFELLLQAHLCQLLRARLLA